MSSHVAFAVALIIALVPVCSLGQEKSEKKVEKRPAPYTSMASGQEMYTKYCASCHGKDGTGNGPAAGAMKTAPTDLTTLAQKNHGEFPYAHVQQAIRGDADVAAHGSKDMPVWGPIFWSMEKESAAVQLRVKNLNDYIKSLQKK
jgi:mono/diheme cytochrome c family protein